MNIPCRLPILYFWHKLQFDKEKMKRCLWQYFGTYKEDELVSLLKRGKISLVDFVAKEHLEEFDAALNKEKGEFMDLMNHQHIRTTIEIMTVANYGKEDISRWTDGYSVDTIALYQTNFCRAQDISNLSEFFSLLNDQYYANLWHAALVDTDLTKISKMLAIPESKESEDDLLHYVSSSLLKSAKQALKAGNARRMNNYLNQYRYLTQIVSNQLQPDESLFDLLKKPVDLKEPKIYTMEDLNNMAQSQPDN